MSYSVLFREFPLQHLDALAPIVARTFHVTDFDARTRVRKGWGFIERDATEERAKEIVTAMGALAGGAVAVDNEKLRKVNDPRVIIGGDAGDAGFTVRLQSPKEPTRLVNWSDVSVAAAGRFAEDVIQREAGGNEQSMRQMMMGLGVFMITGIPPVSNLGGSHKKKEQAPVKTSRVITFGRVVTTGGEQFVFGPNHFDFSGLGAKKELNTLTNFRVMISELASHSSAKLNLGARLMLDNQSLAHANYSGLHDFETELLWLMNS